MVVFFERIGEVVVDDDFIVVQNDVADKIFHKSFSYAYILYVTTYCLVQELNDFCGSEFCESSLLFLFYVEVKLGYLGFEFFQALFGLFGDDTLFDSGNQVARCFQGGCSFCFKRFYISIIF